jgi:hypothetical protein
MSAELAVVLHGVQPATWRACRRVIDAIGDVAALPLTLALAPGAMEDEGDARFIDEMQERLECGDELAAAQGTGREPPDDDEAAIARVRAALRWFASRRWPLLGLVAERRAMSPAFRQALCSTPLRYAIEPQRIYALPQGKPVRSRRLSYSADGMLDRLASLGRNAMIDRTEVDSGPLLRFELQPGDADDSMVRRDWQRRLTWHLQYRQARTMADVMRRWQCEKQPA